MKLHLAFTFALALSVSAFAQQTPQQIADAELPSLITIYKDLHTHPELSTHEERSAAIVAKELKAAGCEVTERVGKYDKPDLTCFGVIGVMKNGDGPVVAVLRDKGLDAALRLFHGEAGHRRQESASKVTECELEESTAAWRFEVVVTLRRRLRDDGYLSITQAEIVVE